MTYIDPKTVLSPRDSVSNVEVIFNNGPARYSWSIAKLMWADEPRVGIRWNGEENENGIGMPQARGNPTWFVVPKDLADCILHRAEELAKQTSRTLEAAYREMASDYEREIEAEEWCEGLIAHVPEER